MSRLPSTNCPRCEAEQNFLPWTRETDHAYQEVYIRCTICRWEQVISYTTPEIETARLRFKKATERMEWEKQRFGWSTQATNAAFDRASERLIKLTRELDREVRHGTAVDDDTA